jgi:Protein of unknown function (DUF1552)
VQVIVKVSRRKLMLGVGASAVVLPFMESLLPRSARAQMQTTPPAKRCIILFTPNGHPTANNNRIWVPTGGETDFVLSNCLKPLDAYRSDLTVISGLDGKAAMIPQGDPHGISIGSTLTGVSVLPGSTFLDGFCFDDNSHVPKGNLGSCDGSSWGGGISVDQLIANYNTKNNYTVYGSLNFSVKNTPATLWTRVSYSAPGAYVDVESDPGPTFDRIFMNVQPGSGNAAQLAAARMRQKSALDDLVGEITSLQSQLGSGDKMRLDAHLTAVRQLEDQLTRAATLPTAKNCMPPTRVDLGPGVSVTRNNGGMELNYSAGNDMDLQMRHQVWLNMTVAAMACDLSRVAVVMLAPSRADTIMTWLGFNDTHHTLSHANDVPKQTLIQAWYAGLVGQYWAALQKAVDANGTPLSANSVIWWCNEVGYGPSHLHDNKCNVLLGSAGGFFKTGRYVKYPTGTPDNVLLSALAQSMGIQGAQLGPANWNTGDMELLTG